MRDIGFTEVVELGCTPDEVFWYVIGPKTASTVDPSIIEWRSEEFPPRVGTLNHLTVKGPLGVRMKMTSRFTEFDPPHRMVVVGVSPFFGRWTKGIHRLEEVGDGVRYTYSVEMNPPFGFRILHRTMARRLSRGVRNGSARLLERFGRRPPP